MRSFWRVTGWMVLALGLLVVVGLGLAAAHLADLALSPDMTITVDDETIHLAGFSAEGWLLALGGVLLAAVIVLVVLPLALLFGIGVPLLLCVGGVVLALLVAGVAMLAVASPLIALVLLVVWALRPRRPRSAHAVQPDLPSRA